jgi:hypothetical protein
MREQREDRPEPNSTALLRTAAAFAVGAYAGWAALAWWHYGGAARSTIGSDALLDRFMPVYDVADRHATDVAAPAAVALDTATRLNLLRLPVAQAIIRARELILGATRIEQRSAPQGLLDEVQSLGWGILERVPDREIVVGAATRPWEASVTFRSIPSADFATFSESGYVKIAWTLRADPRGDHACVLRTDTRAIATDAAAARRFRRYWALLSPGIVLIRVNALHAVKKEAERRARGNLPGEGSL